MIKIKEYNIEDYFIDNNIHLNQQNKLINLFCYCKNLTSLKGIENCNNLELLSCSNNQLTSLKGIEKCPKLEWLYCDDVEDITQYKDKIKNIEIYLVI
jgi:Leucine-rich repeat (LRR) protein